MVWIVHVNASTSRQRPSGRNNSAAAAASCACNAASKLSSQRCASAGAVACFLSAMVIIRHPDYSSWSGLSRGSTSLILQSFEDVDGRNKSGHDVETLCLSMSCARLSRASTSLQRCHAEDVDG